MATVDPLETSRDSKYRRHYPFVRCCWHGKPINWQEVIKKKAISIKLCTRLIAGDRVSVRTGRKAGRKGWERWGAVNTWMWDFGGEWGFWMVDQRIYQRVKWMRGRWWERGEFLLVRCLWACNHLYLKWLEFFYRRTSLPFIMNGRVPEAQY